MSPRSSVSSSLSALAAALLVCVPVAAQAPDGSGAARRSSPLDGVAGVVATRDIDYVPLAEYADARDRLDLFMPEGADDVPVVVFFHGGELRYGSKASGESLAARIVPEGIGVVSANYRLWPTVDPPNNTQDAAAAVAWVIEHIDEYGGDPSNVYVSGHSAGAYLVALMGVDDSYLSAHGLARSDVRGWIPIAAFLYTEETGRDRGPQVWGSDPDAWLAASVSPHIGSGKGRFLIIYADGDDLWRREQNDQFAAALEAAGSRDVRVVEVPNRTHTSLMTALPDADDRIGPLIVDFIHERSGGATVTGPIPVGEPGNEAHDFIQTMSGMDLAGFGYVEQEYFIEGTANRYTTEGLETGSVIDDGHAYKTRFVVRRPRNPNRFNGTVVVEWNNVTAGQDIDIDWLNIGEHLMRNGYVWIGVSAQRVGVDYLVEWSPTRYGSLDVTEGGTIEGDALSYDIFADVADAVRRPDGADPLPGFLVERVFATGHSQSAGRLAVYLNNVHPLRPVFDAVMVHGGGGRMRDDQPVKIFHLMAETDMRRRMNDRQPDSDTFRQWEVAGTSHVDQLYAWERARNTAVAAGRMPGTAAIRPPQCDRPAYSRVPFRNVMHAAFEHMVTWVRDGVAPPTAPPLQASPEGSDDVFARDEHGNVLGGIRLAAHEVPTATNTGINSGSSRFCFLYGSHEAFDAATVAALYPTHEDYVDAVRRVVAENLEAGYIVDFDAAETLWEAEHSDTGGR
ncbi:MAG: alpha/beta hydrolase domain-containing protein [Gemmatimonadota bacterium]